MKAPKSAYRSYYETNILVRKGGKISIENIWGDTKDKFIENYSNFLSDCEFNGWVIVLEGINHIYN